MVYRRGINCLIIDPYNELEHLRPRNISETEYVSGMLSKIRKFSRKHSVAIWLVAHPTKMQKDKNTGQYPVPTPYDVAGSAHFRNKMDNCLTIFRPNYRDHGSPVEIHIQKIRDKQVGKHGQVDLFHDYPTGRYGVEFGCWSGNTQPEIPRQQEVDEDIFSLLAREESTGTIPSNDDVASNDDSDELPF